MDININGGIKAIKIDEKFDSYDDVDYAISLYEKSNFVQLWKRDARKIEAMKKRAPNKFYNDQLIYSNIKFCCIHGGRDFKSYSSGNRPNQSTFRKDCPFQLNLRTTRDGKQLVISELNEEHNHAYNENLFKFLPRQRQLSGEEKERVQTMLRVNANKKQLQREMMDQTGKVVVLKDLHNVATDMKKNRYPKSESTLEIVNSIFLSSEQATLEYITDSNELKAIYYQDKQMKDSFQNYPEVIFVDATFKTNNLRMPLYFMLSIDGNGQSEFVCVFLLTEEEETLLTSVMEIFKKHNTHWNNISVILTDKDMTERNSFHKAIPQANLQLCLFHVLRSFKREITPEKLGITSVEKSKVLEILQTLAYCKSEEEYCKAYEMLNRDSSPATLRYYNRNWHPIKSEWVVGLKQGINLGNNTNNRIESINDKIKSVVKHNSSLPEFAEDLLTAIKSLRTERDHKTMNVFQKRSVTSFEESSPEYRYRELVTPYGFSFIQKQLQLRNDVTVTESVDDCDWIVQSSEGSLNVTD